MKTPKKSAKPVQGKAAAELPESFYRLNSLLHTIRCIAQHEDQLCVLAHEIKRTGSVRPSTVKELSELLAELPSRDYTDDLHELQQVLAASSSPPPTKPPRTKKTPAR